MARTAIKRAAVLFGATVAGLLATGAVAHAAATPTLSKSATMGGASNAAVAYVRDGAIYVSRGATETRLTEDQVNSRPRFSPDGKRIAYVHNRTIWVMNADGTGKRQASDRVGAGASWSPDGTKIAFAALSCTGGPGVYQISSTAIAPKPTVLFPAQCRTQPLPQVASIESASAGQAIPGPAAGAPLADRLRVDDAVAWSPDGSKIAFRGGECEDIADACLTVGTVANGHETAIDVYGGGGNEDRGFGVVPAWRPDGKKVTWTAETDDATPVHVVEADVTGTAKRTVGTSGDREMVYLGTTKGVLTSTYQGHSEITVVNLATGARTPLHIGSQPTVQP